MIRRPGLRFIGSTLAAALSVAAATAWAADGTDAEPATLAVAGPSEAGSDAPLPRLEPATAIVPAAIAEPADMAATSSPPTADDAAEPRPAEALAAGGIAELPLAAPTPGDVPPEDIRPADIAQRAPVAEPADVTAPVEAAALPEPTATAVANRTDTPSPVAPLLLPEPPEAAVTIRAADAIAGAIELRLRDDRGLYPVRLPKRDRDAVAGFYAARRGQPLWTAGADWNAAGHSLVARLARADEDGLDPADYAPPLVGPAARATAPADAAEAELKLSASAALYARDARGGRIEPSRLSALITPKLELPAADAVLGTLAAAIAEPGDALAGYNPAYPGYRALRAKLSEIRARRPAQPIAQGPRREVMTARAVAVLSDVPDMARPIASVDPRLEGDLVANMERWRWLPAAVASRYVFVNIPEFKVRVIEDGRTAHEARVITGKPESPTPIFSGTMDYAVVNPSWYIPPSIMKKEILPGLAADPDYAAKRGYEVIRRGKQITVRQPPGERNALGFVKFMFPNQHAVYLHDTPNRSLFGAGRRAFSHGCVRVDQPFLFADAVLGHEWTETRLKRLIGRGERTIFLPQKLPVHLAYFTLAADEAGELRSFEDIYGVNRRVRGALGLRG